MERFSVLTHRDWSSGFSIYDWKRHDWVKAPGGSPLLWYKRHEAQAAAAHANAGRVPPNIWPWLRNAFKF